MNPRKTAPLLMPLLMLLALILVGMYFLPRGKKTFRDFAAGVPEATIRDYEAFHAVPMKHTILKGVTWEYRLRGNGPRTILFLHGMGGEADFWWQQVRAFEGSFRIIAPVYPPVRRLEDLAAGIIAILDAEKVDRATVVGTSLGGYLAQYLLARNSDRIERVLLGNSFPPNDILAERNRRQGVALHLLPEWAIFQIYGAGLEKTVLPASHNDPLVRAHTLSLAHGGLRKSQLVTRFDCIMQPFEIPRRPEVPMLIIESDNDPLVPPELRALLQQRYPDARVFAFHDVGHFPYISEKDVFNRLLRHFLLEPAPPAGMGVRR